MDVNIIIGIVLIGIVYGLLFFLVIKSRNIIERINLKRHKTLRTIVKDIKENKR